MVGTVTSQRFEFLGQSIVLNRATLEVDRALAGELAGSSPEVSFTQFGGPELGVVEGGHRHPWLVQAEADPLLLPGDRVLLFLSRSEIDGVLRVVPWSGQITFVDQRARVLEGSPLHGQLNGLTEALTIDLVLAAVAAKP